MSNFCNKIYFIIFCLCIFFIITENKSLSNKYIECKVTKILDNDCFEYKGHMYLEQRVQINENKLAFVRCGSVINCNTFTCKYNISVGTNYICSLYTKNTYLLPSNKTLDMIYSICIYILIMIVILCTYICEFIVYIKNKQSLINDNCVELKINEDLQMTV